MVLGEVEKCGENAFPTPSHTRVYTTHVHMDTHLNTDV